LLARRFAARYFSAAPPPAAPPKLSARKDKIRIDFVSKKKRKNFKELFINLNGRSGCTQLGLLQIVQSGH
jgi:hypothetical protein